jgi:starch-binding outer membrane protein SusE/F
MKNYLTTIVLIVFAAVWFTGCKKDENRNFFLGGKAPVFSANPTNVVLDPLHEMDEAVRFTWTNPEYQFSTGLSSQDVQYALEFDVNTSFTSANKYVTTISKELSKSYTVVDFNKILGNSMLLPLDQDVTIYARVVSSLRYESSQNGSIPSNVVTIKTKPYAPPPLVAVPSESNLWATGDAFNSGWQNPLSAPYDVEQKFTKLSNTKYEAIVNFKGGGGYKLIQKQGEWSSQYHRVDGDAFAGNFEKADAEPGFIGPAAGRYKITIDFQIGKFSVVPQ